MPAIYLISAEGDEDDAKFVAESLMAPLPALGFNRVITNRAETISATAAVLVLVSPATAGSEIFIAKAVEALRSRTPVVVIQRPAEDAGAIPAELRAAATIPEAVAADKGELWRRLGRLLTSDVMPDRRLDTMGDALLWNVDAFSVLLADAARRNDFEFGSQLVTAFAAHIAVREHPYPATEAGNDLDGLRRTRQFVLMRDYAKAAIDGGSKDPKVRRQYGQALIELKRFGDAIKELLRVVATTEPAHREHDESRGLIGRAYKQQYVDAHIDPDGELLGRAIETYWEAYEDKKEANTWHGINAASCIQRALRDGVPVPPSAQPEQIADEILTTLRRRADPHGRLEIWDAATRVEACIALGNIRDAERSLDAYLAHPDITPFEVTSTYRQFDEVLQLGARPETAGLLEKIVECVVRLRAGGRLATARATDKTFLLRVADPAWQPTNVPDLKQSTRLGSIVTIAGSQRTIKELLKDPLVISIEESRPAGKPDCEASEGAESEGGDPDNVLPEIEPLDFIGVATDYRFEDDDGEFQEKGSGALVAVIDNGIDVLHSAFRNEDGSSCIVAVWDQTDPDHAPGSHVPYGRLHTADDIAKYVDTNTAPERLRRGRAHGTYVASIAVGRPYDGFNGGVAPAAQLLIVVSNATEPIGYSAAYLAGLNFVDEMASKLDLPVVVNISQGMNAGAHDGLSSLEAEFDKFCNSGRARGRVVIKSAGNERDKRGHAKLTVPPGGIDELDWRCPPGDWLQSSPTVRLELWWNASNRYRFQLRSPSGDCSAWVDRKNTTNEDLFPGQGDYTMELVPSHVDNAASLLKIDFTRGDAASGAPDDTWRLTVVAEKVVRPGDIHAWIERHDAPTTVFATHHSEEMTLSVPGTANSVITVGAVQSAEPIRVGRFSSFGPTRRGAENTIAEEVQRPDICAPGVQITGAKAGTAKDVMVDHGTSAAAPHVTGAIALVLSRASKQGAYWPTASQVRHILRENTRCGNQYWDRGQGFGVLNVRKLLCEGLPSLV